MAFDEKLAERIRGRLGRKKGLTEKRLFGGVGFLVNGNLACAVSKNEMLVRVVPEETDTILTKKHTRVFGTRPMKGWILVAPEALKTDKALSTWIQIGVDYASSLPPK